MNRSIGRAVPVLLVFLALALPSTGYAAPQHSHQYQKPYVFTSDWHSRHIEAWTAALSGYADRSDLRYLEVGVFQGRSFFWVLEEIATHPTSRLTAADINTTIIAKNVAISGAADRIDILEGRSQETLRHLPKDSFDIIYIDGSHKGDDVLVDAVLSWSLLKTGGTLIFDDYMWYARTTSISPMLLPLELRPKEAIDLFITLFRDQLEIVDRDFQLIVRRKPALCANQDLRFCSPIGTHAYDWKQKTLVDPATKRKVSLTRSDREAIEAAIFAIEPGETRPSAEALRNSGISDDLAKRVGIATD